MASMEWVRGVSPTVIMSWSVFERGGVSELSEGVEGEGEGRN